MDISSAPDEHLMQMVKNDHLDAANQLFLRYKSRIFGFFRQVTGDMVLGEDLTQDVFERMILYRTSYREGYRFQTWIFQIARNVHLDQVNSHNRKPFLAEQAGYDTANPTENPYDPIFYQEQQQRLHHALQQQPEVQILLIDLLAAYRVKTAIPVLEAMLEQETVMELVKDKAAATLATLL